MRILQLIDSLDAGGAERMAVNYANALQKEISFSALCTTRKEGQLKELLASGVEYIFLDKKKTLDFKAIFKLRSYVKKNRIEFMHAHSSSFFTAVLLKFSYPKIKNCLARSFWSKISSAKKQEFVFKILFLILRKSFDHQF